MKNEKISVVIAAYNEEPRIGAVLRAIANHPIVDEVIVVNDGSNDNTSDVVKKYHAKLIENEKNLGKTLSVKKGVEASRNDTVMLLDADLVGLDEKSITMLAEPVLNKQVNWTLSLRGNSFRYMKMAGIDWVSGERVLTKELLADPMIWSKPNIGFGLETLMNRSLLKNNRSFISVYLPNVKIINKTSKVGFLKGVSGELKMLGQLLKVAPIYEIIGQFLKMSKLNKKNYARINQNRLV